MFLNSILGSESDADIGVCNEIISSFGKKTIQQRLKILKTLVEHLLEQDYFMSIIIVISSNDTKKYTEIDIIASY